MTDEQPASSPPASSAPAPKPQTAPVSANCYPSYPDFCIPPPPPDLNCTSAVIAGRKNFTVLPPDPHRFDADRDGVGCESRRQIARAADMAHVLSRGTVLCQLVGPIRFGRGQESGDGTLIPFVRVESVDERGVMRAPCAGCRRVKVWFPAGAVALTRRPVCLTP